MPPEHRLAIVRRNSILTTGAGRRDGPLRPSARGKSLSAASGTGIARNTGGVQRSVAAQTHSFAGTYYGEALVEQSRGEFIAEHAALEIKRAKLVKPAAAELVIADGTLTVTGAKTGETLASAQVSEISFCHTSKKEKKRFVWIRTRTEMQHRLVQASCCYLFVSAKADGLVIQAKITAAGTALSVRRKAAAVEPARRASALTAPAVGLQEKMRRWGRQ